MIPLPDGSMDRRHFLLSLPALGVAPWVLSRTHGVESRRLRLLVLGGTDFVGPHFVESALRRGHEVTLFNRGITNPHFFPDLEKLRGNRFPDRGNGLAALQTSRTWDAVIDTWQGAPGCVDLTAGMLAHRAERYLYISSVATYRHYRQRGMTEEGPLLDASEHTTSFADDLGYARRKRASEQAVEGRFGERAIVLRCTSIQGPNRSPDARLQTGYWSYRFLIGEPVLVPDDPTARFQLIDVRDLAAFAVRALEEGFGGAFNMVGPEDPLLLREYAEAWSQVTSGHSPIVWADPAWLLGQGLQPFNDIRNWIPGQVPEPGFYEISNARSVAHGLKYRPLKETIRDEVASKIEVDREQLEPPPNGMSRERELELIRAWESEGRV